MTILVERARLLALLVIAFLSIVDTSFIAPILSGYARSLGAGDFEASVAVGIYSAVAIPSTIAMGYLVDRVGRRKLLIPLFILDAVSIYLYSLASNIAQLIIARILHAIFDSGVFPASLALFRGAIEGKRVGRYLGLYWVFISLGIIVGSSTASIVVLRVGFKPVFWIVTFLMILGILASLYVREIYRIPARGAPIGFSALSGYWGVLIPAYLSIFILYISIGSITGALTLNLSRYYGFSEREASAATGVYMAISTAAAIPANIAAGFITERRGAFYTASIGSLLLAISMAILTLRLDLASRIVSALIHGSAMAMIFISSSEITVRVPEGARGSSSAIYSAMLLLGVAIGSPIAGYLAPLAINLEGQAIYTTYLPPTMLSIALLAIMAIYVARGYR